MSEKKKDKALLDYHRGVMELVKISMGLGGNSGIERLTKGTLRPGGNTDPESKVLSFSKGRLRPGGTTSDLVNDSEVIELEVWKKKRNISD